METDFKVYKRKIHVYIWDNHAWYYAHSTNAYKTCREAVAGAIAKRPQWQFKANFAKD